MLVKRTRNTVKQEKEKDKTNNSEDEDSNICRPCNGKEENGKEEIASDGDIGSDLEDMTLEFIACQQCGKYLDSKKTAVLAHMRKMHIDEQEAWKDTHPEQLMQSGHSGKKKDKVRYLDDEQTIPFLDYRKQKDGSRPYKQWCTVCKWKFISAGQLGKHARIYHNNIKVQMGNTFMNLDDKVNEEIWQKYKFSQRCAYCLHAVSKVHPMMEHMAKEHEDKKPVVYNVKGSLLDNLRKICMKSDICKDFLQTQWEMDPSLQGELEEKSSSSPNTKKENVPKEDTVEISVELMEMITHNLSMIHSSKELNEDKDAKNALKDTINVLNSTLKSSKK